MPKKLPILFAIYIICFTTVSIYIFCTSEDEKYDTIIVDNYIHRQMTDFNAPVINILQFQQIAPTLPIRPIPVVAEIAKPVVKKWKVPRSIIKGVLMVETSSILKKDDTVKYVNKRRGLAGERGPTQIKPGTFEDYKKPGESFAKLEKDPMFAVEVTERILVDLKERLGSWKVAVQAYNNGPGNIDRDFPYWERVTRASQDLIACLFRIRLT